MSICEVEVLSYPPHSSTPGMSWPCDFNIALFIHAFQCSRSKCYFLLLHESESRVHLQLPDNPAWFRHILNTQYTLDARRRAECVLKRPRQSCERIYSNCRLTESAQAPIILPAIWIPGVFILRPCIFRLLAQLDYPFDPVSHRWLILQPWLLNKSVTPRNVYHLRDLRISFVSCFCRTVLRLKTICISSAGADACFFLYFHWMSSGRRPSPAAMKCIACFAVKQINGKRSWKNTSLLASKSLSAANITSSNATFFSVFFLWDLI